MRSTTPAIKSNAIVLTGIGDNVQLMKLLTRHWHKHGVAVQIFRSGWQETESIERKLDRLKGALDRYTQVSLVGVSAGGSLALNAYVRDPEKIHRVITVGSRLRGETSHQAFHQSLEYFKQQEAKLIKRHHLMTVRARFGDELVPADTAILEGACNITVPCFEHRLSIGLALTYGSQPLIQFLRS